MFRHVNQGVAFQFVSAQWLRQSTFCIHCLFTDRRQFYAVEWGKGDEKIGYYKVELASTVLVKNLSPHNIGKFRFHFDSRITTQVYDMHSLVIKDFTVNEVKDFTFSIMDGEIDPKLLFSRTVVVRHYGKLITIAIFNHNKLFQTKFLFWLVKRNPTPLK